MVSGGYGVHCFILFAENFYKTRLARFKARGIMVEGNSLNLYPYKLLGLVQVAIRRTPEDDAARPL